MKKRILSILLSVTLLCGSAAAGAETVLAAPADQASGPQREYPAGRLPLEVKELPEEAVSEDSYFEPTEPAGKTDGKANTKSAVYNHPWDKYSNYYFYNKMTNTQRAFYDSLDKMCRNYLETNRSAAQFISNGRTMYYTGLISASGLTKQDIWDVLDMFRFSNPQYYFLSNVSWSSGNAVGIGIYRAFVSGTARKLATNKVQSQLDTWGREVAKGRTDFEKARIAHDLINNKVSYNYDFYTGNLDEEAAFTQSAYSAICMDKTVCAGYSQAYQMLCNSAGVDTVSVTSKTHQWNKVRLGDSWYNVDCTWDDYDDEESGESAVYYDFFARSDAVYDEIDRTDPNYYGSHEEEDFWGNLPPACTLDSGSTYEAPGTLPVIEEKTADPVISYEKAARTATLSCETKGADIYYSLDGTTPSPSSVKCRLYNGKAFKADGSFQIRAVAVADAHLDSSSADTGKMDVPPIIQIQFKGNGATSGTMQSCTYDGLKADTIFSLPANKFKRTGYTFAGWNTKANGTGTKYANKQSLKNLASQSSGKVILYAQWKKVKYKITYHLKGGKNSKKNPSYYYYTTKTIKLQKATRKNYTFKGWYADKKYRSKVTSIKKGSTGNKALYAKWVKKK